MPSYSESISDEMSPRIRELYDEVKKVTPREAREVEDFAVRVLYDDVVPAIKALHQLPPRYQRRAFWVIISEVKAAFIGLSDAFEEISRRE